MSGEDGSGIAEDFVSAFEAWASDEPGAEFVVREKLSHICFSLYRRLGQEIVAGDGETGQDNVRIRKMLDYVHSHFAEDVTLAEIARAADVGERECLRCFRRTIQVSPMQYLLKFRIMQGADLLVKNPAGSIAETATRCGFDSPSNFTKMFKRFYSCTPREYRRAN